MLTGNASMIPEKDQKAKASHAVRVLTDMADTTCKLVGLNKKKTKTNDVSNSLAAESLNRGEKDKQTAKQQTDEYYDDRLSQESHLDSHLTELVSDKVDCGQFGNIEAGLFIVNDEDDNTRVTGEFHEEAD